MHNVKSIRDLLGLTQAKLGEILGCSQGNANLYEHGQTFPVYMAHKLIAYAASQGLRLTLEDIYPAPELTEPQQEA